MKYLLIACIAMLALTACSDYGKELKFNNNSLYYTKNITQDQAQQLGNYLVEQKFFVNDGKPVSVQLDKAKDTFLFRFVVKDSFVNDPTYIQNCQMMPGALSNDVFNKNPVVVHFCDDHLRTKRVINPQL